MISRWSGAMSSQCSSPWKRTYAVGLTGIVAMDRDLAVPARPAGRLDDAQLVVEAVVGPLDLARLPGGIGVVDRGQHLPRREPVDDLDPTGRGATSKVVALVRSVQRACQVAGP